MRIENLMVGGYTLGREEAIKMYEVNRKLQDAMQDVVLKLIELHKEDSPSPAVSMVLALHDFELIVEDEMCEAEDLIREEVPENKLEDFADMHKVLEAARDTYTQILKERLNK